MKQLNRLVSSLTVSQHAALLLFVFAVGQLLFSSALIHQLFIAREEASREARLKDLFGRTQAMAVMMHDYRKALERYANHRTPESHQLIDSYQSRITGLILGLRKHLNDRECRKALDNLEEINGRVVRLIGRALERTQALRQESATLVLADMSHRTARLQMIWISSALDLMRAELELLNGLPADQSQTRATVRLILLGAAIALAVLAAFVTRFFMRRVCGRLAIMVDNTQLIAREKPMNPPLEGSDEIARLDRAMHRMAGELESEKQRKQALLAMVSHELRTPLNAVSGSLELLSMGMHGDLSDSNRSRVDRAQMEIGRIMEMLNDLLDLEKLESGTLVLETRVVYVEDVLAEAVESVAARAKDKNVSIEVGESPAEVQADPGRMKQVFAHLLSNAIKASPEGGVIEVTIEEGEGAVIICVKDNGPGVNAEDRDKLFDRYRRRASSPGRQGYGMGLPICRHLIELHKGSIGYRPNASGGSAFHVELPSSTT